jgi:HK97 family phage prohead protease
MDISEELNLRTGTKGAQILNEAEGIVEAFVSGIGNKDSVGDIVEPGAFQKSLERRHPRVIWSHDWNLPVGKVLEIYEVSPDDPRLPAKMKKARIGGLYAKVQFNLLSEKGREAFASVAFFGKDQEWSIGYKTLRSKFDPMVKANRLQEVELFEVSPVLHGANQLTGTVSVKTGEELVDEKGGMGGGMGGMAPSVLVPIMDDDDEKYGAPYRSPAMDMDEEKPYHSGMDEEKPYHHSDDDDDEEKGHMASMIPAMLSRMMGNAEITVLMKDSDKIVFRAGDKTYMMQLAKVNGRMMFSLPMPVTVNVEPMVMTRKEEEEYEEEEMEETPQAAPTPMGNLVVKVNDDVDLAEIDALKVLNVKVDGNEIYFLSTDGEDVLKKMVSEALFSAGVKSVEGRRV